MKAGFLVGHFMSVTTCLPTPIESCFSEILKIAGLIKGKLGQFLGYECSSDFYHCRWQSDGFRTYRKQCKAGLVYDVLGTQNCNYDYNVNSCGIRGKESKPVEGQTERSLKGETHCNATNFYCPLSEQCLSMSKRCDGSYDCTLEEDEQNCPLCTVGEFACVVSEQCIALERRCNGVEDCTDGTDERNCNICGNGLFHCAKSGECVSINDRCDGKRQCPHGEDEMLCKSLPSQRFMCQSRDADIAVNQSCSIFFPSSSYQNFFGYVMAFRSVPMAPTKCTVK
uniref:Chitin-binding type-2 domain-containing protein n=1 Tax=Heterorhabditis bacteriophora TaxID=37862 RepID=A0A1I7XMY5_HETBA